MKNFKTFTESIIDIPRKTYAPFVFDDVDTSNPKIKQSVIAMIEKQLKEFAKEYPILKYTLIGSILTKRYRNDADLDINVLFDVPKDKREGERERLSKDYLSSKNPDNVQGKFIPGTQHPVNYYFITDIKTYDEQNAKADAAFDIKTNKFIKRPEDYTFDMNLYLKDFQKKVDEIDVVKGELTRDIIDYDELQELKPGEIKDLQKNINSKLDEIKKDIQDIINIGDVVDAERRSAFDKDMSPDEIKTFSIKNRLPKNVVYKMLEKYHYLKFYKKCKKILDDGEVTDPEIALLRKEGKKHFKEITEISQKIKGVTFTYGRFNPPTVGHMKLAHKMKSVAGSDSIKIFTSHTTDKKKNPLTNVQIRKFMNPMLPRGINVVTSNARTVFDVVVDLYDRGFRKIKMVVGSDRVREFEKLLNKYNGKKSRHGYYNFAQIKVVSAGARDPDSADISGMSASKMRQFVHAGQEDDFIKALPKNYKLAKQLYKAVQKGMGIREDFPDFMYEIYDPSVHEWGTEEGREYAQDFTPYEPIVNWSKLRTWREAEDLPKNVLSYKEKMYKDLKKERDDFVKRYGERADEVMHATAMTMAKRKYGYT